MKISIIIPVYGVEKSIAKCAKSVFNQTFKDYEVLFINDCTSDNSISVLKDTIKKYQHIQDKIRIIDHEVNKGLSAARNTGVRNAKGKYIYHLDSDDYIAPNTLEDMYNLAEKEDADIVIAGIISVFGDKVMPRKPDIIKDKKDYINKILLREAGGNLVNKLFRRDLIVANNLYSVEDIAMAEDYVLYPRIVYYANRLATLNKNTYYYIQNSQSIMHTYKRKYVDDLINSQNILNDFFNNHNEVLYENTLNKSTLLTKKKAFMIASIKDYSYINDYAKDINLAGMPWKVKFTQTLVDWHLYHILKLVFIIKTLLNKLKLK